MVNADTAIARLAFFVSVLAAEIQQNSTDSKIEFVRSGSREILHHFGPLLPLREHSGLEVIEEPSMLPVEL